VFERDPLQAPREQRDLAHHAVLEHEALALVDVLGK
jgi:hypothetical protein